MFWLTNKKNVFFLTHSYLRPQHEKNMFGGGGGGLQTTKVQTSLPSLINAFVIRLLESIVSKLAASEISIVQLVSVDGQWSVIIWASTRQNLSSGFLKKRGSNLSPQLHRLSRNLKFHLCICCTK